MKIIKQILDLIINFFNLKIKETDIKIKEEQERLKKQKSLEKQKEEAEKAVFNGDVDAINKIINTCIAIVLMFTLTGCFTEKIIYVQSDREIKKITYENVEGYFVPTVVMSELIQYKIERDHYKNEYEKSKSK